MNLVKWFRKNNKKVMAAVVIVIMFGFVGGSYLSRLGQRRRGGLQRIVAYFADGKKITNYDLALAGQELETLKALQADDLLRSQDLQAILLSELLFSERAISPALTNRIKQMIRINEYSISDKQINDIYRRSMGSNIYWLLLKNEAQSAGIRMPKEPMRNLLGRAIPQLFPGATYPQLIGSIINRQGIPEKEILATFGRLLTVLEYAKTTCSGENVTTRQIMHNASRDEEKIDVEFVKFDSKVFAEDQDEPTQQKLVEHFDKYKKFFAGTVSEENPYGFGYKLPDRVQLEYVAVKLDDVSGTVTAPTQEEAEEYYQKYREQLFTEQVPSDMNDPNSPLTEQTKSYAEVASEISDYLLQNKINSKADMILQEAKMHTEAGLQDTESANLSAEQFRQMAGDYEAAAEELSKKYKIKVYMGQTGLLNAADMQADRNLGLLYVKGYGYNPVRNPVVVRLPKIVFAIDELGASELGPFDVPKPRLYENIGPMKNELGQIIAVVRIIKAEKAAEPESINQTFSTRTLRFETATEPAGEDIYSVKEKVAEDLRKLAAMDTTKSKAEEFVGLAVKNGWENAVEKFNDLYRRRNIKDEGDPNDEDAVDVFKLENLTNLQRISRKTIEALVTQSIGNPTAQFLVDRVKKESRLRSQLYSLVPQDSNTVDTLPLVVEFKPNMSYYCLKNISVKRLNRDEYEKIKALQVYKEDIVQSQSMAAVHFNPENILKRMNFKPVTEDEKAADTNVPAESEGAF